MMNMIKKSISAIESLIPAGILTVVHTIAKNMFKSVMTTIAPGLYAHTQLTMNLAKALVWRERETISRYERTHPKGIGGPVLKFPMAQLPKPKAPGPPPPTATPTPPTTAPSFIPTVKPTMQTDWGETDPTNAGKGKDQEAAGIPDAHTPGQVDIPKSSVPDKENARAKAKADTNDPVYKHITAWMKRKQGAAAFDELFEL